MRKTLATLVKTFVACTFLFAVSDCGLQEFANCRILCEKKHDCGSDSNYDITNCTNSCSNSANQSSEYARKVNTCYECVHTLSCNDYKVASCLPNCPSLP